MKRHLVFPLQFDTRAHILSNISEHWDTAANDLALENQSSLLTNLRLELGERNFDVKLKDFKDLGTMPFSIISHHNPLFMQARYAFIHGLYYPALTAASALGERILNHLFLDLRHNFPRSEHDRKSHTRQSIDDWSRAMTVLSKWGIFQHPEVEVAFEGLRKLRHRSLHFNASTVDSLRIDALEALGCLALIVEKQFGFQFSKTIPGSKGAFFLRKDSEADPFIRQYYLPQCPRVSPYYKMKFFEGSWLVFDYDDEQNIHVSDDEFLRVGPESYSF